ncbi:hypothetical protein [Spiroplasma endosymbiont of Zeiraphera isertana]|uniref:hypothetical protein n=1 Tax=Spiroplasma endosymbiont of Zeiraphera isertana TaxID=3066313 RepID=UPI00313ABE20
MNLKSLLSEIKFDYKEIIEIFRKIAAKKEDIKSLWDELSKYKQQLQKEKSFNFHKNSWWNKKNHQPGLKFDFI